MAPFSAKRPGHIFSFSKRNKSSFLGCTPPLAEEQRQKVHFSLHIQTTKYTKVQQLNIAVVRQKHIKTEEKSAYFLIYMEVFF